MTCRSLYVDQIWVSFADIEKFPDQEAVLAVVVPRDTEVENWIKTHGISTKEEVYSSPGFKNKVIVV